MLGGAALDDVGPQTPLSAEILGPVLSFYRTRDLGAPHIMRAQVLAFGGEGHTLGLHGQDAEMVARMSDLPAPRIVAVNTPSLLGGMGFNAGTDPSPGHTWSGSIVSDNVADASH